MYVGIKSGTPPGIRAVLYFTSKIFPELNSFFHKFKTLFPRWNFLVVWNSEYLLRNHSNCFPYALRDSSRNFWRKLSNDFFSNTNNDYSRIFPRLSRKSLGEFWRIVFFFVNKNPCRDLTKKSWQNLWESLSMILVKLLNEFLKWSERTDFIDKPWYFLEEIFWGSFK